MRVGVSLTISEDAQIAVDMLAEIAGQLKSAMTARLKVLLPEVAPLLRCALAPSGSRASGSRAFGLGITEARRRSPFARYGRD